jgi:phage FluMu protein gp41
MKKIVKLTESDIERIVRKTLNEDHAKSDSDKIGYIISALDNLSSEDLDKVYNMVEELDPHYDNKKDYDGPPPPPPPKKSNFKGGYPFFQFDLD